MPDLVTTRVQQLFVRHQSAVRAYVLALTADFVVAEDVVQETFLTVTAKSAEFRPDTNFVAWACAIARLKVLENRREGRRFSPVVLESLGASVSFDEFQEDRLPLLLACLEQLPDKARDVVRLRYFSEHGPSEIARMLGRTVAGVNAALVKARDLLRRCVATKLALAGGSEGGA